MPDHAHHEGAKLVARSRLTWRGTRRPLPGNEQPRPPFMLLRHQSVRPHRYGPTTPHNPATSRPPPHNEARPLHIGQIRRAPTYVRAYQPVIVETLTTSPVWGAWMNWFAPM
jgi:hypothetical protein